MKDYFKVYEDDCGDGYWAYDVKRKANPARYAQFPKYQFIENLWTAWYDDDYIVPGHPYTAVWEDRPLGYRLIKVKSVNSYYDRCAIESEDGSQYVLFDLYTKTMRDMNNLMIYKFGVLDIREYHIDPGEEALIRLTL